MNKLFRELSLTVSPAGCEKTVRELLRREAKSYADEITSDVMGNLVVRKKGSGKKVMLCAHMDEIALIATFIDEKGFVRFAQMGGQDPLALTFARVVFENGVEGVVAKEEGVEKKDLKLEHLFIDIGAKDQKSAEKRISIGMTATFEPSYAKSGNRIFSKALDNRAGCFVLLDVLKKVKSEHDLYFVFSTQEELGLRGARTAAYELSPEIAIAVDVTSTGDTPGAKPMAVSLGKGPAIKVKDASVVTNRALREALIETAKENKIPYQLEVLEKGGTDAGAIHLTKGGVLTAGVSVPCRYIHTPSECADVGDIEKCVRLLCFILEGDRLHGI